MGIQHTGSDCILTANTCENDKQSLVIAKKITSSCSSFSHFSASELLLGFLLEQDGGGDSVTTDN